MKATKISTARRPKTDAERALRDAARLVYSEQRAKGKLPDAAWDRVNDLVDCNLVGTVRRDETRLGI